jgi:hypothetical protein
MPELPRALRTSDEQQRYRMLLDIGVPHGIDRAEVEERIAQAADARIRYQRLQVIARIDDADLDHDRALSGTNLAAPVETYRQLLLYGHRYAQADLERVQTTHADIRCIMHRQ